MDAHRTVGLMADPGLAEELVGTISGDVADRLSHGADERWVVEVRRDVLPLGPEGMIDLGVHARGLLDRNGWDYVLYLTDLPAFRGQRPLLAEVAVEAGGALVVLPTLGAVRLRARVLELVTTLLRTAVRPGGIDVTDVEGDVQHVVPVEHRTSGASQILLDGRLGPFRVLSGMVRGMRPWRLPKALSSCIAAGAATGAFGIFYGSIWSLADALSALRLLLIAVIVITLLTGWLVASNGLWNRDRSTTMPRQLRLENVATVITVAMGACLMYLALFAGLFVMGLAVVEADYLTTELQHPAGLDDYVRLSWLSASLGTLAGALGSNFDQANDIREATYTKQWHRRREMFDSYRDHEDDS